MESIMKISYKNIWCKDSWQKYEDLIPKYLEQRIWRSCTI